MSISNCRSRIVAIHSQQSPPYAGMGQLQCGVERQMLLIPVAYQNLARMATNANDTKGTCQAVGIGLSIDIGTNQDIRGVYVLAEFAMPWR